MELKMIAAVGKNNELGKDNDLIWPIKEDLKFFKNVTTGHTVIMGANTFFSLPKVLKKIGLHENECTILDEGLDVVLDIFKDTTGIRDLEQAAEHLAAHALYLIEVDHVKEVVYNADMVKELFSTHH